MSAQENSSLVDQEGNFFSSNATSNTIIVTDEIQVSLGVVMVMENVLSIILLSKCTRLPFQIRILTLNLAVSDILTGSFLAIPNSYVNEVYRCDIKKYPCFLFTNVSLLIFTMMNLDRCFAFVFAMQYYSFITEKLIIRLCIFSWTFGCVLTYGMFFENGTGFGLSCEVMAFIERNTINMIFRCTTLCIILPNLVIFGYLLHHIRKGLHKVHSRSVCFSRKQSKCVKKISLLTSVFLAAYFPFMIIYTFPVLDLSTMLGRKLYAVIVSIVLLNSACNPFFYVWRFKEPRYHLKKLLCFWNREMILSIDRNYNQKNATYEIHVTSSSM